MGHALVCLVGTFLLLHEEVQETMLEELVAALPVFASGVLGLIPTSLMERDDGVGEMMSLIVVAIWVLIAYGLFLLMRNIYHVFLEAVDPEQKAHASLRRRGPKILARLKRAASSLFPPRFSHRKCMGSRSAFVQAEFGIPLSRTRWQYRIASQIRSSRWASDRPLLTVMGPPSVERASSQVVAVVSSVISDVTGG